MAREEEGNGYLSFPEGQQEGSPAYVAHLAGHVGGGAECCAWCEGEGESPLAVGMAKGVKDAKVSQEDGSIGMVAATEGGVNLELGLDLGEWEALEELAPPPMARPAAKQRAVAKDGRVIVTIPSWLMKEKGLGSPKLEGEVVKATEKAILFRGHVLLQRSKTCHRCGLEITNPVSQIVGYGPICSEYIGIPRDVSEEEIKRFMEEAKERTLWEGWLPKSKIRVEDLGEKGRYGGY